MFENAVRSDYGIFAIPHKACRHNRSCDVCKGKIEIGTRYYSIVFNGAGIQTWQPAVHEQCLDAYYEASKPIEKVICRYCSTVIETKEGKHWIGGSSYKTCPDCLSKQAAKV